MGPDPTEVLIKQYSTQNLVTDKTPPAFIVAAINDKAVPPANNLLFYKALLEHHVPSSYHVFPQGAHYIALRNNPGSTELWTALCEAWMNEMGFLNSLPKK